MLHSLQPVGLAELGRRELWDDRIRAMLTIPEDNVYLSWDMSHTSVIAVDQEIMFAMTNSSGHR
jgi:hypothetical protein